MKYFHSCTSLEEALSLYRDLAMKNHPDKGGDLETMKDINVEYEKFCKNFVGKGDFTQEEIDIEVTKIEAYINAINAVINLDGIQLEVIGTWLWVSGNTFPHRTREKGGTGILKDAGFIFAPVKKTYYFRTDEYKTNNRKKMSLDEIRAKYGSTKLDSDKKGKFIK